MSENEQFAFGDWNLRGINCPISTASMTDAVNADEVGEDFDDRVQTRFDLGSEGTISFSQAKDVWGDLVDSYEGILRDTDEGEARYEYIQNKYELASKIQSEIFEE